MRRLKPIPYALLSRDQIGGALRLSVRLEASYARKWELLVTEMHRHAVSVVKDGVPAAALDDIKGWAADASFADELFRKLETRFDVMFSGAALKMAPAQIMAVDEHTVRDLNLSLKDVAKFVSLKADVMSGPLRDVLRQHIAENVDLITRIPREYLGKVKEDVRASIAPGGKGLQDLLPALEERYGEAKRWANQVARDQTRKAYNDINAERCAGAGIKKGKWLHTGGSNQPRPYHLHRPPAGLNGLVFEFANPPVIDEKTGERGLPGQAIFCRCTFQPVVNFEDDI